MREDPSSRPGEGAGRVAAVVFSALLILPVKDLLQDHPSGLRLTLVLGGLAAFVAVFLGRLVFVPTSAAGPPRALGAWLAVALAVAVALVVGDGGHRWAPLFIFLSAIVGVRLALPWAAYGIAACTIVAAAVLAPTSPLDNTVAVAVQALAIGALMVGMSKLRATIEELQEAREQLARLAVTEERLRFARDLHDLLGHSLSVIALKAELAARLLGAGADGVAKEVADIDSVARTALAEVREAVSGYRQPTLADAVATGHLALDAARIEATWDVAQVQLPDGIDVVLGWAIREAITNVVRHSRAQRCWVRVTASLVEAAAEVVDDGVGAGGDGDAVADGSPLSAGNGLRGLAERVAGLGGRLEAGRRPEGGFRLRASVPTPAALAQPAPPVPSVPSVRP